MRCLLMKAHMMKYKQSGATLMEVMVAMSISLVVTASMIALMASTLSSTARIVQMTRLSDDMRVALQMMSRDVRRSSYNANSMFCYSNEDCDSDIGLDITLAGDINWADRDGDGDYDCFTFLMDRDHDGDSTEDSAGGFRRVPDPVSGFGVIEMWTGDASPDCSSAPPADGWVQITNPENMDIFAFIVDDLSETQVIKDDGVTQVIQKTRKVRMDMQGRLVLDNTISRHMEDVITVRNDLLL
jgi:type II secretory pathway component PulJ